MAASLMCSGVSKSGSPALKVMMSTPSERSFAARADTARVAEGLIPATRCATLTFKEVSSYSVMLQKACNIPESQDAQNTRGKRIQNKVGLPACRGSTPGHWYSGYWFTGWSCTSDPAGC